MYRFTGWVFAIHIILIICSLIIPHPFIGYFVTAAIVSSTLLYQKNGFFLLFVFFPFRPFLVEINNGLTYLGDALIIFILAAVLLKKRHSPKTLISIYGWLGAVALFFMVGLLSGLLSGITLTAGLFQGRALLITLLVLIIAKEMHWNKGEIQQIILISILTAVTLSIHGIIEKLTLRQWLLPEAWTGWNLASANAMRIYGLIGNPNVLATYLLIVFFLSFLLKKKVWWLIPVRVLIVGATLLTFSRGALLAFGAGTVIFLLLINYWKKTIPLLLYGITAFVLIYSPVVSATEYIDENGYFYKTTQAEQNESRTEGEPHTVKENNVFIERFKEMFASETVQASAEWGRIYVVLKGTEIFLDSPLIGSGFATYGDAASQSFPSPIYKEYGIPEGLYADNQYISILTGTGIIGLLIFFTLFGCLVYKLWKIKHRLWRAISLSAVTVLLTAGLFYNILEDKTFTLYFYFIIGYILNKQSMETNYEMD
ncbi:O-antigen ligase family protein [Halobacillus massiliensis]|uniref:O-antigen ligase family protein n=1 Tax=Halobacillus massiliensis TaxID=1926286 RepID=UPI0009E2C9F5|nr:O-antigen ligase family protein [Halobacillus massiliensis]